LGGVVLGHNWVIMPEKGEISKKWLRADTSSY